MTLVEVLVSLALFGLFSLLMVSLITSSLRSYARGKCMQEVKAKTSMALRVVQEDISKAYLLPTIAAGSWIPSAILLPNPYGVASEAARDEGEGRARNRLVMSISSVEVHQMDVSDPLPVLRFVEYVVEPERRNRLLRKTYLVKIDYRSFYGFKRDTMERWMVDDQYFTDGNLLNSSVLVELPGVNDTIDLEIERPRLESKDYAFDTLFDRRLFRLKCRMTLYMRDDLNSPVAYEEEAEARTAGE
jgi:hypothetical protein